MKVTESTRICSAHFAPGCTVPNVRSPSLTKQEQPARRVLIRNSVKTRSKRCTPVLSLSELCKKYVNTTIAKSEHLEHANDAMKEELTLQGSTCSELKATLSHASQQVATLQAQHEFLQAQHRASADKIESLQNQLSKLSLENESLQKKVHMYEEKRYRLRAEDLKNRDKDVQFYTGFTTWNLLILFFQSLQVYDVENLQYVGRERTFPEGEKKRTPTCS